MANNIDPDETVQKVIIDDDTLKFKCPFGMTVSGSSQSGKSEFLFNLIKFRDNMFTSQFSRIIYCQPNAFAPKNQEFFKRLQDLCPNIELCSNLPSISTLNLDLSNSPSLLLIDDLMTSVLWSKSMVDLLANDVHNYNISVVIVLQNYFAPGKYGKSLVRNCQYRVFFYNRIEQLELRTISSQVANAPNFFAANFDFLIKTFPNAPSYYLLIDGHYRTTSADFWCRSNIFPEGPQNIISPIIFYPSTTKSIK